MSRASGITAVALAALVAAGAGAASAADDAPRAGAAKAKKGRTHKATVGHGYYSPSKLTLKVGDKIRWTWQGSLFDPHDVTVEKGPQKFRSPVQAGGTYTRTFRKAGSYLLVCTQHPEMTMTVKVKKKKRTAR